MANLMDYLEWRGDVPLAADPFGPVDNLVLAELAYVDFHGIVSETGDKVPLKEVRDTFYSTHTREEFKQSSFAKRAPLLLDGMADGARFGGIELSDHINQVDREKGEQMSAVTYHLPDGTVYVAFRGTDGTVVGWREDFDLSYADETPGQVSAKGYLERIAEKYPSPLRVGGHSKGGNFAVYAASFCGEGVQDRILEVYSNDGPGFRERVLAFEGYRRIRDRILSIVPDTSIIGMLLDTDVPLRVVKSSASGILQHDALTWQVLRNRFVEASLSDMGKYINKALDAWVAGMDDATRRSLIETVFSMIEATGMETFGDISEQKWKSAEAMLSAAANLPKEKQQELLRMIGLLLQSGGKAALPGNA